jgi:endonuclease/exonuclease/phosphatase family metal-dependent hydrolase
MARLTVATWNMLFRSGAERTLAYLEEREWDIASLQEVRPSTSAMLAERTDWAVIDGLTLASDFYSSWKRPHAAALVARNGWTFSSGGLIPNNPKPGRGIQAVAERGGARLNVISWHAPNAAAEGAEVKMAGYSALLEAIGGVSGPLVAGIDANHWSLGTELELVPYDESEPAFAVENRFFASEPEHRLRDALVDWLRANPQEYRECLEQRPHGPLKITYKRGATYDRFDYLMISDEFRVRGMTHDYEGAIAAGSDHAFVSAVLELS